MKSKRQSIKRKNCIGCYRNLNVFDKVLDVILFGSIIVGTLLFLLEFLIPGKGMEIALRHADFVFLGVFFVDITRTFFKGKDLKQFMRHHWFELVIVTVVIISLSSFFMFGLSRLSWLIKEEKVFARLGRLFEAGTVFRFLR
tara:strand:- start:36207 stop:36632 length:426 start_codon:yes stop_codon:yes gene_type:complete